MVIFGQNENEIGQNGLYYNINIYLYYNIEWPSAPENDFDRKWPWPEMTAFLKFWVTSLHFLQNQSKCSNWFPKYHCKALSVRHLQTPPKNSVAQKFVFNSKFLYLCTSNRKKASLVPDVGLHRRQAPVVNEDQKKGKKWGFWGIEISTIKTHKKYD